MSTRRNRLASGAFAGSSSLGGSALAGDHVAVAGFTLVAGLRAIFKGIAMYSASHPQVAETSQRLVSNLKETFDALDTSDIQVVTIGSHFYVNGDAVRPSQNATQEMAWFSDLTQRTGVVEIRIGDSVTAADAAEFAGHLRTLDRNGGRVKDCQFGAIRIYTAGSDAEFDELLGHLRYLQRFPLLVFYAEALAQVGHWVDQLRHGAQPDSLTARRIIARSIDALHADASGLIGLTTLRPLGGSTVNRRIDAAIIALAIAKQLGMSDVGMLELGTTALVRPIAFANQTWWTREALTGKQAAELAYRADSLLEIVTGFEGACPPGRVVPDDYYGRPVQPHAATLILSAASAYIDLLQPGESSNPFSPETALQLMISQAGEFWDPTVIAAMAHALGLYPPGTVIRLNSGDLAVIARRPMPGNPIGRPFVRPIELSGASTYDLSRPELAAYSIAGSAQRTDCEVNPIFVFLQ